MYIMRVAIDYHEFLTFGGKWYAAIRTNGGQVGSISGFAAKEREKERANRAILSFIDLQFKFFLPFPLTYLNARRARRWFPLLAT